MKHQINEFIEFGNLPSLDKMHKINQLEEILLQSGEYDVPLFEEINGGLYLRKIILEKGTVLTGRIHKFEHYGFIMQGAMMITTANTPTVMIKAGDIIKGSPGDKRVALVLEDTVWATVHEVGGVPQEGFEMYDYLTCGTYEQFKEFRSHLEIVMNQIEGYKL